MPTHSEALPVPRPRWFALLGTMLLLGTAPARAGDAVAASAAAAAEEAASAPDAAPAAAPSGEVTGLGLDAGQIEGSLYTNRYLGMSLVIPRDWAVAPRETQKSMGEAGSRIMAGSDANKKAVFDAAVASTVNLFMLSRHPM